jgi:hypothetical protein
LIAGAMLNGCHQLGDHTDLIDDADLIEVAMIYRYHEFVSDLSLLMLLNLLIL